MEPDFLVKKSQISLKFQKKKKKKTNARPHWNVYYFFVKFHDEIQFNVT